MILALTDYFTKQPILVGLGVGTIVRSEESGDSGSIIWQDGCIIARVTETVRDIQLNLNYKS